MEIDRELTPPPPSSFYENFIETGSETELDIVVP